MGPLAVLAMLRWSAAALHAQPMPPVCTAAQTTFSATGAVQQFTIPAGVTTITIDAAGAQGGFMLPLVGGNGARLVAGFPVTPGETLNVVVGGAGVGLNFEPVGGGGGGGSYVYRAATVSGLLLAAAGGGGAGSAGSGVAGSATSAAANGIGTTPGVGGMAGSGGDGGDGGSGVPETGGGGGGLLTDGGNGTTGVGTATGGKALADGAAGGGGPFGQPGGFGGGGGGNYGGGGGGGGYNGGGGSASNFFIPGGGGGGGSFVSASGLTLFAQSGVQTGDGQVKVCFAPEVAVPTVSSWGLAGLALLLSCAGTWLIARRRRCQSRRRPAVLDAVPQGHEPARSRPRGSADVRPPRRPAGATDGGSSETRAATAKRRTGAADTLGCTEPRGSARRGRRRRGAEHAGADARGDEISPLGLAAGGAVPGAGRGCLRWPGEGRSGSVPGGPAPPARWLGDLRLREEQRSPLASRATALASAPRRSLPASSAPPPTTRWPRP
jgi:hypothetical protein